MRGLIAFAAVMLAAVGWHHYRALEIEAALQQLQELLMQTLVARWRDADNIEHVVTTPREEGETAAEQAARHKEAVDAYKELFPPAK